MWVKKGSCQTKRSCLYNWVPPECHTKTMNSRRLQPIAQDPGFVRWRNVCRTNLRKCCFVIKRPILNFYVLWIQTFITMTLLDLNLAYRMKDTHQLGVISWCFIFDPSCGVRSPKLSRSIRFIEHCYADTQANLPNYWMLNLSYWDLWQATPFMTTKQTTTYAANYRLQAY